MTLTKPIIKIKLDMLSRELSRLKSIKPTCSNCLNYAQGPHCNRFDAAPPAHILSAGCEDWVYDEIPF